MRWIKNRQKQEQRRNTGVLPLRFAQGQGQDDDLEQRRLDDDVKQDNDLKQRQ
jgi:hypothetical protein